MPGFKAPTSSLSVTAGLAIVVFVFNGDATDIAAIKVSAYVGLVFYAIIPGFIILFSISQKTASKILMFVIRLGAKIRIVKNPEATTASVLKSLGEYHQSMLLISRNKTTAVKLLVLSVFYQVALCSIPFFVLHAYNGGGSYFDILTMTVFIYCAITIIPTPGNSGAAEGSFYIIFSALDSSSLFWAMLIWRLICYYSFILIGIGAMVKFLRLLTETELNHINRMVFKVFFSIMMFYNLYTADFASAFRPKLIVFGSLGVIALFVLSMAAAYALEKNKKAARKWWKLQEK